MPPASLPALAAIRPGPRRARSASRRTRAGYAGAARRGREARSRAWRRYSAPSHVTSLARSLSSPKPARRQPRGSTSSSTSSTVTTPSIRSLVVDDRDDGEVVVGHQPRDLLEVGVGRTVCGGSSDVAEPVALGSARRRSASAIAAARRRCGFMHVDPRERLGERRERRTRSSASVARRLGVDADELRAHQPAGRRRVVAEQRAHPARAARAAAARRPASRRSSGSSPTRSAASSGSMRASSSATPRRSGPRGTRAGAASSSSSNTSASSSGSPRDGADDLLALAVRRRLDEVGELGRVQLRELRVRHAQAHGRHVAGERLDATPSRGTRPARSASASARGNEPAQQPRRPGVDADDAVPAVEPRELDLVRAHEARAVDVDQLPVEHVLLQQHLLRAALERAAGRAARVAQRDAAGRRSPRRARRDERPAVRRPSRGSR